MTYDSPKQIAQLLRERGLSLKKRFGQNFLISPGARQKIVSLLAPNPNELVWEVGPGIGSMTHMLLPAVERLVTFEIDHGLVKILQESFAGEPRLLVVAGDYLKTWRGIVSSGGFPSAVIGNLPYNAAAPIVASFTEWEVPVSRAVVTVQREVARRMAAAPGTKDYSSFSVVCQSVFDVQLHGDIAPPSFYPVPEVTSTVVRLVPNGVHRVSDRGLFNEVVRRLFGSRRKTVRNNLLSFGGGGRFDSEDVERALRAAAIEPQSRGEELSVAQITMFVSALAGEGQRPELR